MMKFMEQIYLLMVPPFVNIKPGKTIINYKEALVFSYLGLLYFKRRNNVTSCVTGSKRDHIGGALYGPNGC